VKITRVRSVVRAGERDEGGRHGDETQGTDVRRGSGTVPPASEDADRAIARHLTTDQVWHAIDKASFAVLSYVTPSGEPRSSGVVYKAVDRRLHVIVGTESWKARHIPASGRVAVTVPVRRSGVLSLVMPIPPATISFHAAATVHPADSPDVRPVLTR
jgi:pyridoxamine 5'-phosphate oxidase-like protein